MLNKCWNIFCIFLLVILFSGCANQRTYDYSALKAAHPASILILPPTNNTMDVTATYAMLAQMTYPLAETGYYVVPVALMDVAFKENGVTNASDAQSISPAKLREIFGADAALYTEIIEYGVSYKLISSETAVAAKTRLVDLRTGAVLWSGYARSSSAENQNNNSGGLAGLLVNAIASQIVNSLIDNTYTYAGITSQRLLTGGVNGQILYGPRSPYYGQEKSKKH
jgi:hypothetical protein